MAIKLKDLGITSAGDHPYKDGVLQVRQKHLLIIEDEPEAAFNVIGPTKYNGQTIYTLGTIG